MQKLQYSYRHSSEAEGLKIWYAVSLDSADTPDDCLAYALDCCAAIRRSGYRARCERYFNTYIVIRYRGAPANRSYQIEGRDERRQKGL